MAVVIAPGYAGTKKNEVKKQEPKKATKPKK